MLKIILLIIFVFSLVITGLLLCCIYCSKKKFSVYDLAINRQEYKTISSFKRIIGNYLQDDVIIIVIQDDIKFLDSNFDWPRRSAYVHLSDVRNFLSKYHDKGIETPRLEIKAFIKNKIFIH